MELALQRCMREAFSWGKREMARIPSEQYFTEYSASVKFSQCETTSLGGVSRPCSVAVEAAVDPTTVTSVDEYRCEVEEFSSRFSRAERCELDCTFAL